MKKLLWILVCLSVALGATAQKQQGIVRTLERPGKPSIGLPGVTINVLEYPNTIVSQKGGKFWFTIDGKRQGESFTVTRVQKKGYSLVDKQLRGKRFAYSATVPIEIVMVADQQLEFDKKRIEEIAYKKAKKDYDQKISTLEKQLEEKSISERQYRSKYEELNKNYNNYLQLIDQMAERYATTDYKGMSELNREIQMCIENAELERADSLINAKGSFDKREQELNNKRELKTKTEQLTQQLQEDIDFELADLKQDYINKISIHAADYRHDSTAYYLERIVNLDTTDIDYVYTTAVFIDHYLADYPRALKYYLMTLNYVIANYGEDAPDAGELCQNIGLLYDNDDQPDKALEWHHRALDILKKTIDPTSPNVSMAYTLIGRAYISKGEYDKALEYTLTGLDMRERAAIKDPGDLSQSYNNLGVLYNCLNDPDKSLEYHFKALELREQAYGADSQLAAFSNLNIGQQYFNMHDYDRAIEYLNKAYPVYHERFGIAYPQTQRIVFTLGTIYEELGNYEKALLYYKEYSSGCIKYYGKDSYKAAKSLKYVVDAYSLNEDYAHALEYAQQALSIYQNLPSFQEENLDKMKSLIQELKDKMKGQPNKGTNSDIMKSVLYHDKRK